tara:strand:- start:188 stop:502 length:315 start_codon:yes stop_codon:yes gene_type:complete
MRFKGWSNMATYFVAQAIQDKGSLGSRFGEFINDLPIDQDVNENDDLNWDKSPDLSVISYENFIAFMGLDALLLFSQPNLDADELDALLLSMYQNNSHLEEVTQ